jgi:K+-transporting ATPase ATPase A chain
MARLFEGERTFLHPVVRPLERLVYKVSGVDETAEQHWTHYAGSLLAFSLAGILLTYLIQRIQGMLPFNPQGFGAATLSPDLAFNTAASFRHQYQLASLHARNHRSYFAQMAGWRCITSLRRRPASPPPSRWCADSRGSSAKTIGNFWVDVTRATLYVLLPISIVGALVGARRA